MTTSDTAPAMPAADGPEERVQTTGAPGIALAELGCRFETQCGPPAVHRAQVDAAQWQAAPAAVLAQGGRLVALWGIDRTASEGGPSICAAYAVADGLYCLTLRVDTQGATAGHYPDLSGQLPCAGRMQRAVADLNGLVAHGAADRRHWLRHAAWPADYFPLRGACSGAERFAASDEHYPFVVVTGEGVHEIAVGPVHAGIIEPGHFRFSVVGEKILRLEERLAYTHKGIEKRFVGMDPAQGARLAARVSGDSTVGYGWAYCAAVEALDATTVPPRAQWLRALALERERVANHLADLGALGNDAGFAFGLAQFSRLREDMLRRNAQAFGHRLMMDWIVPGGVRADVGAEALRGIDAEARHLDAQVRLLEEIYDGHAGLQDRFAGTGCLSTAVARDLNLTGLAARASGMGTDLRALPGALPYGQLAFRVARFSGGDVAARVAVRFAEIGESLRLIGAIIASLPGGAVCQAPGMPAPRARGAGWIEGWRGELLVALELDAQRRIARAHCHDPSWQNWPALETAVIGNIVPDFPLINKSFNLSYSGQDL